MITLRHNKQNLENERADNKNILSLYNDIVTKKSKFSEFHKKKPIQCIYIKYKYVPSI